MSSLTTPELLGTLDALFVVFGGYSLGKHLLLCVVSLALFTGGLVALARVRGASTELVQACIRDVLIGVACAASVIAFPAFFFFVGRAMRRAAAGRE